MADYLREASDEERKKEAWRIWMAQRTEAIHQRVSAHDVLSRNGVKLRYSNGEEQISCPFHGQDKRPSARVYPESGRSRSHVWCFVCNQRWDCITLWKKFGGNEEAKFGSVVREMESEFGIVPPEAPSDAAGYEPEEDPAELEVQRLLHMCETRLKTQIRAFDMQGFFRLGVALDRVHHQVGNGLLPNERALEVLRQILDKISDKVKSCPEG